MNEAVLNVIAEMHDVQAIINKLRARHEVADRSQKYVIQLTLNLWHKDMAKLQEQLLEATADLVK
jgi:hypothetical protein